MKTTAAFFLAAALATQPGSQGAVQPTPLDVGFRLTSEISDAKWRHREQQRLAEIWLAAGHLEVAEAALLEAVNDAAAITDPEERVARLLDLAKWVGRESPADAIEILTLAAGGGWPVTTPDRKELVGTLLNMGLTDEAMEEASLLPAPELSRWLGGAAATAAGRAGDAEAQAALLEEGLAAWRALPDKTGVDAPLDTLARYAERFAAAGSHERAGELVAEALPLAVMAPPDTRTCYRLRDLALSAADARPDLSSEAIDMLEEKFGVIPAFATEGMVGRKALAAALARAGRLDEALAISSEQATELQRHSSRVEAVKRAVEAGLLDASHQAALAFEYGPTRSRALNEVARGWLEAGNDDAALAIYLEVETRDGILDQDRLLRKWRPEGDVDRMLAYLDLTPFPSMVDRGVRQVALLLLEQGVGPADLPLLRDLLARVEAAPPERNIDLLWKTFPLYSLAEGLHRAGDHEAAVRSLDLARSYLDLYMPNCDVSVFFPGMEEQRAAKLARCAREVEEDPWLPERNRAGDLAKLAGYWAEIGEYERAFAAAALTGSITDAWKEGANTQYPVLTALRRIGAAYLENGDAPTEREEELLEALRLQALGEV